MDTFWSLFRESIIVQSIVTLLLVSAITYMYIVGQEVPSDLVNVSLLVLGFWFGTKTQGSVNAAQVERRVKEVMLDGRTK